MMTDPNREGPLVDVRDMIVVHTALLREFRLAPDAVRRVDVADRKTRLVVAGHLRFLCELLHHHHQGEDDLLWPKLRDRLAADAVQLVDEGEAQHDALAVALRAVESSLSDWPDDPAVGESLAARLTELHALLKDHLDFEERALLPLAAATMSEDEWRAIGDAAANALPKSVMPLVFGMFAYEGDPEVLRDMLRYAPAPVRVLVPRIAPRVYAKRAGAVHGTSHP